MKTEELKTLATDQLVWQFIQASKESGGAVLDSQTRRANKTFARMQAIDAELRSRGRDARMALLPLLENGNRFVRYYAAKYLLGLAPDHARRIIEDIAQVKFDALSLDAGMCLYALDKGIFRPD